MRGMECARPDWQEWSLFAGIFERTLAQGRTLIWLRPNIGAGRSRQTNCQKKARRRGSDERRNPVPLDEKRVDSNHQTVRIRKGMERNYVSHIVRANRQTDALRRRGASAPSRVSRGSLRAPFLKRTGEGRLASAGKPRRQEARESREN